MDNRVSLITLGVDDISRARAFYEALGWVGQSPDGEVVFFQAGGMVLALWGRDKLAEDSVVEDGGGWAASRSPTASAHLTRSTRCWRRRDGGRHHRPARSSDLLGRLSGIFIDPDGHPWEVAHNPGWTLADDGSVHLPA